MKHGASGFTRRRFVGSAFALAAAGKAQAAKPTAIGDQAATPTGQCVLHFAQPAGKWPDALPVGNGRLGAVVFGQVGKERIQLNEESIWDGEPNRDRDNPRAGQAVPRIRELLFAGKVADAEELATSDMLSVPRRMPCYQTLGDLELDFSVMGLSNSTVVENYRRELDLETAVASTSFIYDGVTYKREVFSSAPDQVIVIRLTASEPRRLRVRASLSRPHSFEVTSPGSDRLMLQGQALPVNDNPNLPVKEHQTGVRFCAELRVLTEGARTAVNNASFSAGSPGVVVDGASSVTLLLDCATSYRYPAKAGKASGVAADVLIGDPGAMRAAVGSNLDRAAGRSYADLLARHIADYQRYFRRVHFDLGADPHSDVATDTRMKTIKAGGEDIHLMPLYFQFGRYLLISSSRPGTLAANLQGIWNESVDPPWGSKYTVNINAEMNYWLADRANLSNLHPPLFALLASTRAQGQRTARAYYGAGGTVVHHNTDIWGDAGPIDGLGGGIWAMGGAWLSLHSWDHYAYTGDRRFLREQAYPALRDHATFLLDYMVADPHSGKLATGPSCSPENAFELPDGTHHNLCMSPTMDISIVRAVLWRLLEAAELLRGEGDSKRATHPESLNRGQGAVAETTADHPLLERARSALTKLPAFQVNAAGRLQEWQIDYKEHEIGHRHISHLFGLYPEDQITPEATPELARAARAVLDRRLAAGSGSTGWSRAWIINCMARLGDGDACYTNIVELFRQCTRLNLYDVCGLKENSPFQIDGNLGAPAGMAEMLVQSPRDIRLLNSVLRWTSCRGLKRFYVCFLLCRTPGPAARCAGCALAAAMKWM